MNLLSFCIAFGFWFTLTVGEGVPVISTEGGKISGLLEEAVNGNTFYSYYGVPFGKPPVDELRFKDPVPASGWQGVRDGSVPPPPCVQIPFGVQVMGLTLPPEGLVGLEDCLYLNVFTPKVAHTEGNIPVMVFIHGGGFFAGGANEYLPHVLLSKDVILVVIQYRLGFLGFLSTEDSVIPGNFGLKDQTLALQWIQKNIKNFGGDPKRVTIFGESAGGASVHFQMLSPKAKGLFSGAIMESGNALSPWALRGDHKKSAREVGSRVGCSLDGGSQAFLKCMQSANAKKINSIMQELSTWFAFPMLGVPRIDGDFLPDHPATLMKEGRYSKVNLIAGVTAHEGAIFTHAMYARRDLIPQLENDFSTNGPHSLSWYDKDSDHQKLTRQVYDYYLGGVNLGQEYSDDLTKMLSDQHFNLAFDLVSQYHARENRVSTFRYELTHRGQLSLGDLVFAKVGHHWVSHGDELYYLFRGGPLLQPEMVPPERPKDVQTLEDIAVRKLFLDFWTNFAATGHPDPDNASGSNWSATSPDDLRHLSISPSPKMVSDTRRKVRDFLCSLPTEINRILHPHLVKKDDERASSGSIRINQDEL